MCDQSPDHRLTSPRRPARASVGGRGQADARTSEDRRPAALRRSPPTRGRASPPPRPRTRARPDRARPTGAKRAPFSPASRARGGRPPEKRPPGGHRGGHRPIRRGRADVPPPPGATTPRRDVALEARAPPGLLSAIIAARAGRGQDGDDTQLWRPRTRSSVGFAREMMGRIRGATTARDDLGRLFLDVARQTKTGLRELSAVSGLHSATIRAMIRRAVGPALPDGFEQPELPIFTDLATGPTLPEPRTPSRVQPMPSSPMPRPAGTAITL